MKEVLEQEIPYWGIVWMMSKLTELTEFVDWVGYLNLHNYVLRDV